MDGIELAKRIRDFEKQRGGNHQVCIIGTSANGDSITKNDGLAAGMDAFFEKPISAKEIMKIMRRHSPSRRRRQDEA